MIKHRILHLCKRSVRRSLDSHSLLWSQWSTSHAKPWSPTRLCRQKIASLSIVKRALSNRFRCPNRRSSSSTMRHKPPSAARWSTNYTGTWRSTRSARLSSWPHSRQKTSTTLSCSRSTTCALWWAKGRWQSECRVRIYQEGRITMNVKTSMQSVSLWTWSKSLSSSMLTCAINICKAVKHHQIMHLVRK